MPLDAATRARLGDGLFEGIRRYEEEFRAIDVARNGADPTLREFIAAVKAMRI